MVNKRSGSLAVLKIHLQNQQSEEESILTITEKVGYTKPGYYSELFANKKILATNSLAFSGFCT